MTLRIARTAGVPPGFSDTAAPAAEVWRTPDGAIWAYSRVAKGERWLDLPGVGSFLLGDRVDEVTAFPEAGIGDEELRDSYRRIVAPISFQAHGGEVFHASASRCPYGVVAFCADSQGGKSTTAYAMSGRGHPVWADDAVAVDFSGDAIATVMLPFVLRLRPPAARFFLGTDRASDHESTRADDDTEPSENPLPLAAVFFLNRESDDAHAPEVTRLTPAVAFAQLLPQAFCFTLKDLDRRGSMMRHYLALSASVPFFELRVPDGLERIGEALDAIELALASSGLPERLR